ncbi:MAG: rubredoxin [Clostridia bacterium]|nr:rubredoxin [Clostridia bacterium]
MAKWVCVCEYVYDPEKGTDEIPLGSDFEDLPEDWVCPECYKDKSNFTIEYLYAQKRH